MTIYVQSRGKSQEHDYRWLEICKKAQSPVIPDLLKKIRVEELIESQKPSLLLARLDKYLLLLVTALESREERIDFMGRRVRNSVCWIEIEEPETERRFRAIAVRALQGELAAEIDQAINIGGEFGFNVNFDQIQKLGDHSDVGKSVASANSKLGQDSDRLKFDLASELSESSLPAQSGGKQILILVTTLKSQAALEQLRVWRGLSSRIESDTWVEVWNFLNPEVENPQKKTLLFGILTAIVIFAIGLAVWLISNPTPQRSQPPTPSQSKEPTTFGILSSMPSLKSSQALPPSPVCLTPNPCSDCSNSQCDTMN